MHSRRAVLVGPPASSFRSGPSAHLRSPSARDRSLRVMVAFLVVLTFTIHLLGTQSAHHGVHRGQTSRTNFAGQIAAQQVGAGDRAAHSHDADRGAEVSPHDHDGGEPVCGDVAPARDAGLSVLTHPAPTCLRVTPPAATLSLPARGREPPRRTPRPVHELGVQRI